MDKWDIFFEILRTITLIILIWACHMINDRIKELEIRVENDKNNTINNTHSQ